MSESVYGVIAYIARYWFVFLGLIIVWRSVKWMRNEGIRVDAVERRLPDAGYIGEWAVVASDASAVAPGRVMRASRDGWIGSARGCDVRLRKAGVPPRAARFFLREDGLHVQPQRRGLMLVDGERVNREAVLRHGATLTIGGVTLQLRLFAGILLEGERPSAPKYRGRRRRGREPEPEYTDEAYEEEYDEYDAYDEYEDYDEDHT